jgi:hypothetical protein
MQLCESVSTSKLPTSLPSQLLSIMAADECSVTAGQFRRNFWSSQSNISHVIVQNSIFSLLLVAPYRGRSQVPTRVASVEDYSQIWPSVLPPEFLSLR